jgi:general secretion pathway protein F
MAGFRYEALDDSGRVQRGVLEVDSPRQARKLLRERGLWTLSVDALAASKAAHRSRAWRGALPASDLALLLRQFATLLDAGLTLEASLDALIEQADTQAQRELLGGVRAEVLAGHGLARAMEKYPRAFPELYRSPVAAGEQSGRLAEVLARLADFAEAREALRSRITLAFLYPALVTLVAVAVVAALLAYVVPQVVAVFQNAHQTLPWLTRALIAASDFARAWGVYVLAGALVLGWLGWRALRVPGARFRAQSFLLSVPLAGPLVRAAAATRVASTLSILVGSGVPVLGALQAAAGSADNLPMRRAVEETARAVREGASLAGSMAQTRRFPPLMVHLAASGESSGRLGAMLERAAASQRVQLEHRLAVLVAFLEPALIVAMGAMVLAIVLAVLMPIIELNQLLGK